MKDCDSLIFEEVNINLWLSDIVSEYSNTTRRAHNENYWGYD